MLQAPDAADALDGSPVMVFDRAEFDALWQSATPHACRQQGALQTDANGANICVKESSRPRRKPPARESQEIQSPVCNRSISCLTVGTKPLE